MIRFAKAHACGNDFLIVDNEFAAGRDPGELARALCSRNFGIGADGVEFLSPRSKTEAEIDLRNADGSYAEISGNGTRCVAAWMAHQGDLLEEEEIALLTGAGRRVCRIVQRREHNFEIASAMGVPEVGKKRVELQNGSIVEGAFVSMGNPHFVVFVADADFSFQGRDWESLGREISTHASFPRQTNVEFVRSTGKGEIEIRIFERGVGPTSSSGTGTCASAAAAIRLLGLPSELGVLAPGGRQSVQWRGGSDEMRLTGPATLICSGESF